MIYGLDISDYQPDFDLQRARNEGFEFVILKSTEGANWQSAWFRRHLDRARAAGLLVAAYHYVRAGDAQAQVNNIVGIVPKDVPLILDIEAGGGDLGLAWDLTNRLRANGYRLPLLYLPRWYWQQIGSPDMSGLPPLWFSSYPFDRAGYASAVYDRQRSFLDRQWGGYGGLGVEILQFSDEGNVAGRSPIDVNAYRGTREQLAALLGGGAGDDLTPEQDALLRDIREQLCGSRNVGEYPGYPSLVPGSTAKLTLTDFVRNADARSVKLDRSFYGGDQPSRIPGDTNKTDLSNAILDTVARVTQTKAGVETANAKLDGLTKGEADLLAAVKAVQTGQVDVNALAAALVPLLPHEVTAEEVVAAFAAHLGKAA